MLKAILDTGLALIRRIPVIGIGVHIVVTHPLRSEIETRAKHIERHIRSLMGLPVAEPQDGLLELAEIFADTAESDVNLSLLMSDITSATSIQIHSVVVAEMLGNTVMFFFEDSNEANALINLFTVALPEVAEHFGQGTILDTGNGAWGADADIRRYICENCTQEHFDVILKVCLPISVLERLTPAVHALIYPEGHHEDEINSYYNEY